MTDRRIIPAEALRPGMRLDDERFAHVMDVGHVTIGPRWVTARAFHPHAHVYPKTAYRIARGDTCRIEEPDQ